MTPKEAFKIGFLEKCARDNLSPAQTMMRIQHSKFMLKQSSVAGAVGNTVSNIFGSLWPLALLAPPVAGVAGGYALAQAGDDTYDSEESKKREEIAEYQRAIDRLRHLQAKQQVTAG